MSEEPPAFVTIVDNAGREKRQRVEYTVTDVRGETVYVTSGGLRYIRLDVPPEIWYLNPQRRKRTFGL